MYTSQDLVWSLTSAAVQTVICRIHNNSIIVITLFSLLIFLFQIQTILETCEGRCKLRKSKFQYVDLKADSNLQF